MARARLRGLAHHRIRALGRSAVAAVRFDDSGRAPCLVGNVVLASRADDGAEYEHPHEEWRRVHDQARGIRGWIRHDRWTGPQW